jgi:hypothetical protein
MIMTLIQVDPVTGNPVGSTAPQFWIMVGRINTQVKYAVAFDDPAAARVGEDAPALVTLHAR